LSKQHFSLFLFHFSLMYWQTSRRKISLDRPLVMGILNVTSDSFSDGGKFLSVENALRQAEGMIADGADIIDVGGESTRPGSGAVPAEEEARRVVPVIEAIAKRFDVPISVDTTKSAVAAEALDAGAEMINDISGLRFDVEIAGLAAGSRAGLIVMHSRGAFHAMHSQLPVDDIFAEVTGGLRSAIESAITNGVAGEQIVIDPGIGFGKTAEQNLELLSKLDRIVAEFDGYPVLVGASRKSFIGRLLAGAPVDKRLAGSVTAAVIAVQKGGKIVRVHDVGETVTALKTAAAIEAAAK
jgi:dihydropteroate synthase